MQSTTAIVALLAISACVSSPRAVSADPALASPAPPRAAPVTPVTPVTLDAVPLDDGGGKAPAKQAPAPPPIPPGTAVLHIGDSFALSNFAQTLKPKMKGLGVRYEVRAETSSFTTTWAGKMERLVADTQPDLVIINLGANEVANVDPPAHAPAVRRIVAAIGGRPCVWVKPPSWRKDTGINDVIRQNSAPCRYYDSDKLVGKPIPRQGDHIHPNDEGGAIWAEAFWTWLQAERAPLDPAAPKEGAPKESAPKEGAPKANAPKVSPWRLKPAAPEEHEPAR